jgi:hypothetical protein
VKRAEDTNTLSDPDRVVPTTRTITGVDLTLVLPQPQRRAPRDRDPVTTVVRD